MVKLPLSALLVYALVLCTELGQSMLYPLLPGYAGDFALSDAQTGAILTATTLATVAAALPAGMLAARRGARAVLLLAGAGVAVSAALTAAAGSFEALLAARLVYGVAFAGIWTAGMTLVAETAGPRALGASIVAGGVAHLIGPPLAGVLSDAAGPGLPFAVMAGATALATAALTAARTGDARGGGADGLRAAAGAVTREPVLRGAVLLIALIGTLTGVVGLVVPLVLDREGLSSSQIGGVFAAGSVMWVLASLAAVRAGTRAVSVGVAGTGLLLIALAALLPAFTTAVPFMIGFVVLRAALQAPLSTINYPLGEQGAKLAGVATGTVMGLLNLVWGAAAAAAPLVTGVLLDAANAELVFAVLAAVCGAAGLRLLRSAGAPRPGYA